jgi:hypothetical protein
VTLYPPLCIRWHPTHELKNHHPLRVCKEQMKTPSALSSMEKSVLRYSLRHYLHRAEHHSIRIFGEHQVNDPCLRHAGQFDFGLSQSLLAPKKQKAGQRTIERNSGRPDLGMGETKDIQNQLERVDGPVVRPSYILVTLQTRALFPVEDEMRFYRKQHEMFALHQ